MKDDHKKIHVKGIPLALHNASKIVSPGITEWSYPYLQHLRCGRIVFPRDFGMRRGFRDTSKYVLAAWTSQ